MAVQIPESYASPNATYAFFKRDHPNAPQPDFHEAPGTTVGVPESHEGAKIHIICTLHYGPEEGLPPVLGYKILDSKKRDSEGWDVQSTKVLGRALKRAGYPGDMLDLKAVRAWERRKAEDAAILAGLPLPETAAKASPDKDLVAAGKSPEVADADHDEVAVKGDEPEAKPAAEQPKQAAPEPEATQPELTAVPDLPPVPDKEEIRAELNTLSEDDRNAFVVFLQTNGWQTKVDVWDENQLAEVARWLWPPEAN